MYRCGCGICKQRCNPVFSLLHTYQEFSRCFLRQNLQCGTGMLPGSVLSLPPQLSLLVPVFTPCITRLSRTKSLGRLSPLLLPRTPSSFSDLLINSLLGDFLRFPRLGKVFLISPSVAPRVDRILGPSGCTPHPL